MHASIYLWVNSLLHSQSSSVYVHCWNSAETLHLRCLDVCDLLHVLFYRINAVSSSKKNKLRCWYLGQTQEKSMAVPLWTYTIPWVPHLLNSSNRSSALPSDLIKSNVKPHRCRVKCVKMYVVLNMLPHEEQAEPTPRTRMNPRCKWVITKVWPSHLCAY